MGDPDLRPADRGGREAAGPPRGLVVFPIESLTPGRKREGSGVGWLRNWWIVFAALILATAVIWLALLVR
jgi:hypothetical protein